ncbi:MAG: hypothetical protein EOM22_18575 [Gammaproteobacteria bacterium]|nr:hypothetical protein [Gammaproteobacteria bacterium]
MATELERRIEALEQTHNPLVVAINFRCQACGKVVATLDESEVCGHHKPLPEVSIRIIVGFGREPTT